MTGRTNAVVAGGGGSAFLAYLQVATDPNAVITAVNLAGDTFSGTADSTGALVLNITEPGTYTVTETDGGVETIAIADNGATYTLSVISFNGEVIINGAVAVSSGMSALAWETQYSSGVTPSISQGSTSGDTTIVATVTNGSGVYITTNAFSLANFSQIVCKGLKNANGVIVLLEEDAVAGTAPTVQYNILYNSYQELSLSLSNSSYYDSSKKYRIGVWLQGTSLNMANINKIKLQ